MLVVLSILAIILQIKFCFCVRKNVKKLFNSIKDKIFPLKYPVQESGYVELLSVGREQLPDERNSLYNNNDNFNRNLRSSLLEENDNDQTSSSQVEHIQVVTVC